MFCVNILSMKNSKTDNTTEINRIPTAGERERALDEIRKKGLFKRVIAATVATGVLLAGANHVYEPEPSPIVRSEEITIDQGENPTIVARDYVEDHSEDYTDIDGAIDKLRDAIDPVAKGDAKWIEGGTKVLAQEHEDGTFTVELVRDPLGDNNG